MQRRWFEVIDIINSRLETRFWSGAQISGFLFRGRVVAVVLGVLMAGFAAYAWVAFTGPRMRTQPHIQSFTRAMPGLPAGAIPVEKNPLWFEANELEKPMNAQVRAARGKVYYGYYCMFCHGTNGKGDGPVGRSFIPRPSDIGRDSIRALPEPLLVQAMLHGQGHDPVLEKIVPPGHREALAAFLKSPGLSENKKAPAKQGP